MGYEYWLVHAKFNLPVALILTVLYQPLFTRIDAYKIVFLTFIAVNATIPWDSYLIRRKIWVYPEHVIVGPTFVDIPLEEIFFFVIQTYNTSLLYLLLSKSVFGPGYLVTPTKAAEKKRWLTVGQVCTIGQHTLAICIYCGSFMLWRGGVTTYLGLILVWAGPFAIFLWTLAHRFLIRLPFRTTVLPIVLSTLYLWVVDTLALRRGTWSISPGTKLGIHIWPSLEIEEAVFFLATNVLIVFGQVAFDNSLAILQAFPILFPDVPNVPSAFLLTRALVTNPSHYLGERILAIQEADSRLQKKSRSFSLASSLFQGRLRIDLILLYSFCRVADDLVDNATTKDVAQDWISKLKTYLDLAYAKDAEANEKQAELLASHIASFPESTQFAVKFLPFDILSPEPLYELLEGFKTDLEFSDNKFPIATEEDLRLYGARVAGTVAELCNELVFYYTPKKDELTDECKKTLISQGEKMGIALQYVNIARDIETDAKIRRVYIPTTWLKEEGLTPEDVIKSPSGEKIDRLRKRLLGEAFKIYDQTKGSIEQLPKEARAPMRVAVESYMEIGRVMMEDGYQVKAGRATVPKTRRIMVAYRALNRG